MRRFVISLAAALPGLLLIPSSAAADTVVTIPDAHFQACLNAALGVDPPTAPITEEQLAQVTQLSCMSKQIADLTGAEHLVNLSTLDLHYNNVSDLTPIGGLTSLVSLNLPHNNVTDLAPLAGTTGLMSLFLEGNPVSQHVDVVAGLPQLIYLNLSATGVSDLTPVAGAASLWSLAANGNGITSLEPVSGLTGLNYLYLASNQITDLSPLAGLTELVGLTTTGNPITDISALAGLPHLATFTAMSNRITDVTPLAGLTDLTTVDLRQNAITDLSPLAGRPALATSSCVTGFGGLCATGQSVVLPNAAVDSPYPITVRALTGASLPITLPAEAGTYDGTALTYSMEGTFYSGWASNDAGGTQFYSGSLRQTVTRPPLAGPAPAVTGVAAVGRTLTATTGPWSPAPVALAYQWFRDDVAIVDATTDRFTLTPDDLGARLHVEVTATKSDYPSSGATSAETAVVVRGTFSAPKPVIRGTAQVGRKLTARTGRWRPAPVTLIFTWYRDGHRIRGATAATYTLVRADRGHRFKVVVTGKKSGYTTLARSSARTGVVR